MWIEMFNRYKGCRKLVANSDEELEEYYSDINSPVFNTAVGKVYCEMSDKVVGLTDSIIREILYNNIELAYEAYYGTFDDPDISDLFCNEARFFDLDIL